MVSTPKIENQMEKRMDNELEVEIISWFRRMWISVE